MEKTGPFSADDLLAHIRGEAAPELSQRIEAAEAEDSALRAELAVLSGMRQAVKTEETGNPPGAFAWRKLEAEIRRDTGAQDQFRSKGMTTWWKAAAVFLGLAVLGQAAYITSVSIGSDDSGFRTASQSQQAHVMAIGFAAGADIADITRLLRDANAQVIDGPGASGLYRVAFASEEDRETARAALEASGLVELLADE